MARPRPRLGAATSTSWTPGRTSTGKRFWLSRGGEHRLSVDRDEHRRGAGRRLRGLAPLRSCAAVSDGRRVTEDKSDATLRDGYLRWVGGSPCSGLDPHAPSLPRYFTWSSPSNASAGK